MKVRTTARRDAILDVAAQVFLERGFERASMDEIAARAGGSKATIYGYFPSKQALFLALAHGLGADHIQAALAKLTAGPTDDLAFTLSRFAEEAVLFLCDERTIAVNRMVMGEAGRSDIGDLFFESGPKRGLLAMAEFFEACMARGELRRADAWVMAQHFGALIGAECHNTWFQRQPARPGKARVRRMAQSAVEAFLSGYAAPARAQRPARV